jgi:hypothetical protein
MGWKLAAATVSIAMLVGRVHPAAPSAEPRDECRLPRQIPMHWRRPVGMDLISTQRTRELLRQ